MKHSHMLTSSKMALVITVTGFSESLLFPHPTVCLTLPYNECWIFNGGKAARVWC